MNRLVIIGNGFDLAHGLKTSYAIVYSNEVCVSAEYKCAIHMLL